MGEKAGSTPKISLGEMAAKVLVFLIFLQVTLPHLVAICETLVDRPWDRGKPTVVIPSPTEVKNAA